MEILLVGATGLLGPEICARLTGAGQRVRALLRTGADPAKRHALDALGVHLVEGDLKDAGSLARACAGADGVISTASSRDVAHATADAVTDDATRNQVVALGGPQALSPRDVVRMFEGAGPGTFIIDTVPADALRQQLQTSTDPLEQSFAGLMLQYAAGDAVDPSVPRRRSPSQLTSVHDFVTSQLTARPGRQ